MGEIRYITGELAKTQFADLKATLVEQLQTLIEVLQSDKDELSEAVNPAEFTQALHPIADTLTEAAQIWSGLRVAAARFAVQSVPPHR